MRLPLILVCFLGFFVKQADAAANRTCQRLVEGVGEEARLPLMNPGTKLDFDPLSAVHSRNTKAKAGYKAINKWEENARRYRPAGYDSWKNASQKSVNCFDVKNPIGLGLKQTYPIRCVARALPCKPTGQQGRATQ